MHFDDLKVTLLVKGAGGNQSETPFQAIMSGFVHKSSKEINPFSFIMNMVQIYNDQPLKLSLYLFLELLRAYSLK